MRSKAGVEKPEGCINFPHIWGIVRRARSVRVAALDRSGNEIELKLTGWPAVLVQHEIDHLYGHLFIDRLDDSRRAHLVMPEDYSEYHKGKPAEWTKFIDVSQEAVQIL